MLVGNQAPGRRFIRIALRTTGKPYAHPCKLRANVGESVNFKGLRSTLGAIQIEVVNSTDTTKRAMLAAPRGFPRTAALSQVLAKLGCLPRYGLCPLRPDLGHSPLGRVSPLRVQTVL